MSRYNVGDKFIIEIGDIYENETDAWEKLYKIKGFNSLVFDNNGLDKLERSPECAKQKAYDNGYEKGLKDAWELAKKLFADMSDSDLTKIFGEKWNYPLLMQFTPQEALAKLEAYEKEREEIKVGDVVTSINGECENLVTNIQLPNTLHIVNLRSGYVSQMKMSVAKKTGKHIDIQSLLNQIGE